MHEKIAELCPAVFAVIHQVTAANRFAVGVLELVGKAMDLLRDLRGEAVHVGDRSTIPMSLPLTEVARERETFVFIFRVHEFFVLFWQLERKYAGPIGAAPAVGD